MNIALVFCGQARWVKESYESIHKHIILPNKIDNIFAHFWVHHDGTTFKPTVNNNDYIGEISNFFNLYKPVTLLTEKQQTFNYKIEKDPKHKAHNDCLEKYSIHAGCSRFTSRRIIINHIAKYYPEIDYVIDMRVDILPQEDFRIIDDKTMLMTDPNMPIKDGIFGSPLKDYVKIVNQSIEEIYEYSKDATTECMHLASVLRAGVPYELCNFEYKINNQLWDLK